MKILIQSTNGGAHKFINIGLSRALSALGYECYIWDNQMFSPYDIFDKVKPDIFLGQTYNLTRSIIELIKENPLLKVGLRASDRSSLASDVAKQFPILIASEEEIKAVNELREATGKPTFLHNHYPQNYLNQTHEDWIKEGYNVISLLNAADIFQFVNGQRNPLYESDLCFVGGYWPYKSLTLDDYILRLSPDKYKLKIFGNQRWPGQFYCGQISDQEVKHIFSSSKICLNVHEKHSQVIGNDIIERPFKLLSNKCFVISDYVQGLVDIIPDGIVYANSPKDLEDKIDYYLSNPEEKKIYIENGYNEVIKNHTYIDRAMVILNQFGLSNQSNFTTQEIKDKLCASV